MDLTFLDPLTQQSVAVSDLDQLVHHLAKTVGNQHIQFLGRPFPAEAAFMMRLQQVLNTEKLPERLTFEAEVAPETIDEEACRRWRKMNFTRLRVRLPIGQDLTAFRQILALSQRFQLALTWLLETPVGGSEHQVAENYWFLRDSLGHANIEPPADSSNYPFYSSFAPLIKASAPLAHVVDLESQIQQQAYAFLYQWLTTELAPNVKTILEINPFAEQQYYQQFLQQPFPWKITALDLPQHDLPFATLNQMNKTFDAIVLFQALDHMHDPQRTLLMLQKYARPTTLWVVLNYNIRTIPTLIRLMMNQWDNVAHFNPMFQWLKCFSQKTLEKLFQMLSIDLTFHPIKGPIDESYQKPYDQIHPLIEGQPEQADFEAHFNVQAYLASGMLSQPEELNEGAGFITSGFLNSF